MSTPPESQDIALRYLEGNTSIRTSLIRDSENADALRALLGEAVYAELVELAGPTPQIHLSTGRTSSLIFVPGVMGSVLVSRGLSGVWWMDIRNRGRINDLALAADGTSDAHASFKVQPATLDMSYEPFLMSAAAHPDYDHTDFPYDWRKPLITSADELHQSILATRTAQPRRPIHLVAHSMGGLVVRTALMRHPELWNHIGKVVFIGTPHYGSPAIGGYLKNHLWGFELLALLGRYLSRETFRSLSGVLTLLPAPAGTYPLSARKFPGPYEHPCVNFDLYNAAEWHLKLAPAQELNLQERLDAAKHSHEDLHLWHMSLDQALRDRMAIIVGTGFKTLFRLAYTSKLKLWHTMDRITTRQAGDPHRDGDGRVPLVSATLPAVRNIRYVKGEHGSLPNLPAVQNDVWNFLADRPMTLPQTAVAALDLHLGSPTSTKSVLSLPGSSIPLDPDDPGYLNLTSPTADQISSLEERLATGVFPDFLRTRLL
ncbi:lipase family alpha/beta hydrolase [Streptomyces zhihengii]|uniref:lipase family alpha/beta hydrolase n=1 Tax=Streptomyces zhihengii TaxID=1818004 RepID=UPI0033A6E859